MWFETPVVTERANRHVVKITGVEDAVNEMSPDFSCRAGHQDPFHMFRHSTGRFVFVARD